jgi:hypothetical protein
MMQRRRLFEMAYAVRSAVVAVTFGLAFLTALMLPADARGGHGTGRDFAGPGMHGTESPGGRRHGNDAYIKAASDDRDRLLNTRLKSICHGC